jgi:hypothetical protein
VLLLLSFQLLHTHHHLSKVSTQINKCNKTLSTQTKVIKTIIKDNNIDNHKLKDNQIKDTIKVCHSSKWATNNHNILKIKDITKVDTNQNLNTTIKIKETATVECTTTKITSNIKEEIKVTNLNRITEVTNTKTNREDTKITTIKEARFTNQETTTSLMDGRLMTRTR